MPSGAAWPGQPQAYSANPYGNPYGGPADPYGAPPNPYGAPPVPYGVPAGPNPAARPGGPMGPNGIGGGGPGQPNPGKPGKAKREKKPKKKRSKVWSVIVAVAILVLICTIGGAGYIGFSYWSGQNDYDELIKYTGFDAESQVEDRESVTTVASVDLDWEALSAINPDIVGWVYMPDTIINYPICWKEGDDEYYTKYNFWGRTPNGYGAEYGCIALSGENSPNWTDQVNFISGHHMRNGSMFALFGLFTRSQTFNEHRTVFVFTPQGNFKLTSFCTDKVWGESTDIIIPNFNTPQEMQAYMQQRINDSIVKPDPQYVKSVTELDQVFAFYTCNEPDNRYRIITYCKVDEFVPRGSDVAYGSALVDESVISDVESAVEKRLD